MAFLSNNPVVCDPLIKAAIESLGTIKQAAEQLNVSEGYLYMLLNGTRKPSKNLLRSLKLSKVELITRAQN